MESQFENLRSRLIVSCQALENEPLHSSFIMGRMAKAAYEGGAAGIRANTVEDILEIRKNVSLPVIGIIKAVYDNSEVYITPTLKEVDALMEIKPEIIALDATKRIRPDGTYLREFFEKENIRIRNSWQTVRRWRKHFWQMRSDLILSEQHLWVIHHTA